MLGVVIGTFFMAAHSAQGPQLGLPQMIQSRPQFGYVGAILVWLFAYLQYAGFNVFNSILAAESMHARPVPGSTQALDRGRSPSWPPWPRSSATTSSTGWSGR